MSQPVEITKAIQLYKQNQLAESRQILREYLSSQPGNVEALLWLAKVTSDSREAIAAAELALALEPENEIAKRAVLKVHAQNDATHESTAPLDISRLTGMTLSQAREVIWPFNDLHRPIGVLMDEGIKSIRDMAWAAAEVRDPRLKEACRTIVLAQLVGESSAEPTQPARVIDGYSYTALQERRSILLGGAMFGLSALFLVIGMVVVLGAFYLQLSRGLLPPATGLLTTTLAFASIGLAYLFTHLGGHYTDQSRTYRAGREGEQKVKDALRASLSQPWVLIHNLEFPDRKWGDVDLVLIGPGGTWIIEVKSFSGDYRVSGDRWQYKSRWGWRNMQRNPGDQARQNARNVKDYLDLAGVNVKWVRPVVVWAGEDKSLSVDAPTVPVWRLSELPDQIEEFWHGRRLSDEQIQQAAQFLEAAVEKVKASRAVDSQPKQNKDGRAE